MDIDKLKELFRYIKNKTDYMEGSWGDTSMLSRMALEDDIIHWSIEKVIDKFCQENKINLDEKTCVICNKLFTEFGANPSPVKESGVCCNKCDNEVVIPARMEGLNG